MKKRNYLLLVFWGISVICVGQKVRNISLHYNAEDFSIGLNSAGQLTINSTKHIISFKSNTQLPALPYIGVNVLVAPSEEYVGSSLSGYDTLIREGIDIAHNPVGVPSNVPINTLQTNDSTPYQAGVYPTRNIEYAGSSKMGGYKILSFLICPFKYDATNKHLFFISDFVLTLSTRGEPTGGISGRMAGEVEKMVINNYEIDSLYNKKKTLDNKSYEDRSSQMYEYIIVTNEALKPTFQKLADWKTQKGVLTKILTVEEISSDYSRTSQQAKIKNALKSYYESTQHKLQYVLLGGDTNIVPAQFCYGKYENPDTVYHTSAPSDLYYACFDTMEWDNDGYGVYGEIEDSVDFLPEIYVTRASVEDVSHATAFVDRVISYESNPNWNNYTSKALMVGSKTYENYYDAAICDSVSDSHYKSDVLYNSYIHPYWNGIGTKVRFYDTGTDFSGGANYQVNPSNLQTQLSKGYGFVHVMTHGEDMHWCLESSTFYSNNEAFDLNNPGPTIILTSACHTNAFQWGSYCLSEALMRNANSGILAYVGSSHYGWYQNHIDSLGPSNKLNGEIFKRIFSNSNNNFGRIVAEAKNVFQSYCYGYNFMYRWLLFFVNPMGDPEMPIFTTTPLSFNNVVVTNTNGVISANTNLSGCRICITKKNDNSLFLLAEDTNAYTSPTLTTGLYNVCITKPGYIPYIVRVGINQDIYVQNETFATNVGIIAPNVKIGKDVNTTATQGPVTKKKKKMNIKLQNEVLIKNDFEVKTGSVFEIKQ